MKTVILAEKPSQASDYADAFSKKARRNGFYEVSGNGFENAVITYGIGHLVQLYSPEDYNENWKKWQLDSLPLFPEKYKFKVTPDTKKQYKIVKEQLDLADEIIIATDSDREGEAIARLIIKLSGNQAKPVKRLWINSKEIDVIQEGFKNLKNGADYYSSYIEAETRQIADWLIGMNLTRLYTLYMQKNGMKGVFSVGRVQTPTLFLIYQRNQEIENFVVKPFYELYGVFANEKGTYKGKYHGRFSTEEKLKSFITENQLLAETTGNIKELKKEQKQTFAPKLFSLSDLQSEANKKYNMSATETLSLVQGLYDKKFTSYPRSDSNYIGTPEFNYLKDKLADYQSLAGVTIENPQTQENKLYVDSSKVQEHYAIVPTKTLPNLDKLSDKERTIYSLILLRTLAIFEEPYQYEQTTILTDVNNVDFKTTGKIELNKGWKKLYKDDSKDNNKKTDQSTLPNVEQGESVVATFENKKGETQPPKFYTEGTLLIGMKNVGKELDKESKEILKETEGIGTEATRASIIENLKMKDYIEVKNNKLLVSEKGSTLCEVIKHDEISNAEMTAQWERYLKKIRDESGTQEAFLGSIKKFVVHLIEKVPTTFENSQVKEHAVKLDQENVIGVCPVCKKGVLDKGKFYGCSGYSDGCKFTMQKEIASKKLTKTMIKDLLTKKETKKTKGFKNKAGKPFEAILIMDSNNKVTFKPFK